MISTSMNIHAEHNIQKITQRDKKEYLGTYKTKKDVNQRNTLNSRYYAKT